MGQCLEASNRLLPVYTSRSLHGPASAACRPAPEEFAFIVEGETSFMALFKHKGHLRAIKGRALQSEAISLYLGAARKLQ